MRKRDRKEMLADAGSIVTSKDCYNEFRQQISPMGFVETTRMVINFCMLTVELHSVATDSVENVPGP